MQFVKLILLRSGRFRSVRAQIRNQPCLRSRRWLP